MDTTKFVKAYKSNVIGSTAIFVRIVHAEAATGTSLKEIHETLSNALNDAGIIPPKSFRTALSHYNRAGQIASVAQVSFKSDDVLHAAWSVSTGRAPVAMVDEYVSAFAETCSLVDGERDKEFIALARTIINEAKDWKKSQESGSDSEGDESEGEENSPTLSLEGLLEAVTQFIANSEADMLESHTDLILNAVRKGQALNKKKNSQ